MLTIIAHEKELTKHYLDIFEKYQSNELFEVYDVIRDTYIRFIGREGSDIVNKQTLIDNLINLELNGEYDLLKSIIVVKYESKPSDFKNPVFIGYMDCYEQEKATG